MLDLTILFDSMNHAITAFSQTLERMATVVRGMKIDFDSLQRPLSRCDLDACRGTCCHDGVYLSSEEANVIRELVEGSRDELEEIGLNLPEKVVVFGKWRDITSGPKTATRPEPMHEKVEEYPEHFEDTNCVFLLLDARCGLQVLAENRGLHPWFYKPMTCWLHPLSIGTGANGMSEVRLYDEKSDPQRYEDYDGFVCGTHCGRTCEAGRPAYQVLDDELAMLGAMGDRDFPAEIRAKVESAKDH